MGKGYFSKRNDHISELRIEGYSQVREVLVLLRPFLIFKKKQAELMLEAISILQKKPNPKEFLKVCKISDEMSRLNYATTKKKYNYSFIKNAFIKRGLIPP